MLGFINASVRNWILFGILFGFIFVDSNLKLEFKFEMNRKYE
jgi:hypothetical protein